MPSYVNIISWNYDIQMLIAYSNYSNLKSLKFIANELNVFPFFQKSNISKPNFSITYLNGIAGIIANENQFDFLFDEIVRKDYEIDELQSKIVKTFVDLIDKKLFDKTFSYSWELPINQNKAIKNAKAILNNTDILVIIGYSFPVFNKAVDDFLFKKDTLSEVIIQDPICRKNF